MAKRLTDTEKWNDTWFRSLPMQYKLFWNYLCDNCDSAGVWEADLPWASEMIGFNIHLSEVKRLFDGRVQFLSDYVWFLPKFVNDQYGHLSDGSRAHHTVIDRLKSHGIEPGTIKPDEPTMEFDFEAIWAQYPRRLNKKAARRHFHASVRTLKDYEDIQKALNNYKASDVVRDGYVQYGSTWFNNWRDWIEYKAPKTVSPHDVKPFKEVLPKDEDLPTGEEVSQIIKSSGLSRSKVKA